MRLFAILAPLAPLSLVLALAGCSYDTARETGAVERGVPVTALARGALGEALARRGAEPGPDPVAVRAAITPEIAADLPAPTLFAVLGAAISLPQLIAENGGVETWLTEDDISLSTRSGVVVATRGLGFDVMESDVGASLAALRTGAGRATRSHAWLDGEGRIVRRSFDCLYTRVDGRIREECFALGLSFANDYVLRGGKVVVSRQWLGPVLGHISLEQLKF